MEGVERTVTSGAEHSGASRDWAVNLNGARSQRQQRLRLESPFRRWITSRFILQRFA